MTRVVRDSEGRMWTIQSVPSWQRPAASGSGFDLDVGTGRGAGFVMLGIIVLFLALVIVWTPNSMTVPAYVFLLLLLLVLFFPVRWRMRRPWMLVAESPGDYDLAPQRWEGTVYGSTNARREVDSTIRLLERDSIPDDGTGPLHQVN